MKDEKVGKRLNMFPSTLCQRQVFPWQDIEKEDACRLEQEAREAVRRAMEEIFGNMDATKS